MDPEKTSIERQWREKLLAYFGRRGKHCSRCRGQSNERRAHDDSEISKQAAVVFHGTSRRVTSALTGPRETLLIYLSVNSKRKESMDHFKTPSKPPSNPPTTDFSLLESAKENIAPTQSGRSAKSLSRILSSTPKDLASELDEIHRRFTKQIELVEKYETGDMEYDEVLEEARKVFDKDEEVTEITDDPLGVYYKYVNFLLSLPSSIPHLNPAYPTLIQLLELSTRKFLNSIFKQDNRYFTLWKHYSNQLDLESKIDVWRFVLANDVAVGFSKMYEELALCLEAAGR
jgi:hypothetical protein